jgi:hypothetical protein
MLLLRRGTVYNVSSAYTGLMRGEGHTTMLMQVTICLRVYAIMGIFAFEPLRFGILWRFSQGTTRCVYDAEGRGKAVLSSPSPLDGTANQVKAARTTCITMHVIFFVLGFCNS